MSEELDEIKGKPCIENALDAAVTAVYFADNSDYEAALYHVIAELKGLDVSTLNPQIIKNLFYDLNPE